MHKHVKEGMRNFGKTQGIQASVACLRTRRREAALLLGRLRLLEAGARLHLRLLAPGAARRSRRRDAALHECNALVSI